MTNTPEYPRVLALYVSRRGIAYVLFTAPLSPHDWGTKEICGMTKHADGVRIAKQLIERFRPDVVVIEDASKQSSRRSPRIRALYRAIARHAAQEKIYVASYSRKAIQEAFAIVGGSTKHDINCAIVRMIPALLARQPHKRRAWDAESLAQGLFDAVAVALTFFAHAEWLDIAQAVDGEDEAPLAVHCERTPYLISSALPTLQLHAVE
jgi:Holliday junction resolvasome RuvABC endonuclease subunit